MVDYDVMLNNKELKSLKFAESAAGFFNKSVSSFKDANLKYILHFDITMKSQTPLWHSLLEAIKIGESYAFCN